MFGLSLVTFLFIVYLTGIIGSFIYSTLFKIRKEFTTYKEVMAKDPKKKITLDPKIIIGDLQETKWVVVWPAIVIFLIVCWGKELLRIAYLSFFWLI